MNNEAETFAVENMSEISDEFLGTIIQKIKDGKAITAVTQNKLLFGFWYVVEMENGETEHAYRIYRIATPAKEKIMNCV